MPAVFPFRAVQFLGGRGDVSSLVAPPYDVLDAQAKSSLLAKDDRNIVSIDLPHTPAKELGPPAAYQQAAAALDARLRSGVLSRRTNPAMFVYRQTFEFGGEARRRTGVACAVETVPFGARAGGGVLPHEETFSGPKEDRFALMRATKTQLSPIFGLHADRDGAAVNVARRAAESGLPQQTARTADGVLHEVWAIEDAATLDAYAAAMRGEDIFIADGHHRYTTAINYLRELESAGTIGSDHPARRCMMVLVSMSDPGLVIGPTHRVLGGMSDYSFDRLTAALASWFTVEPTKGAPSAIERTMNDAAKRTGAASVLGLIDAATSRSAIAMLKPGDPLAADFAAKPPAWRTLDVALVQHLIVGKVCQPQLNAGRPVTWAFPHSVEDVLAIIGGHESHAGGGKEFAAQVAVVVRPTPLDAVRSVSLAGELMPQKSTFFYPKLATGMFLNPLA